MVGKNGTSLIVVLAVCRSWTWHLSAFVSGWGHLISLLHFATMGLGNLFWPLVCSLPRHHDLWSVDVKYCQVHCRAVHVFKRSWPLQISTFLCFSYGPDSQQTLCSSVSCRWCGNHYGPPSIKVTSCRLQLIIQEVGLETPYGTLEPACLNGRFVAFDERFTSLASDRVILRVFDAISLIHMP